MLATRCFAQFFFLYSGLQVQQVTISAEAELKKLAEKYPGPFRHVRSVACAQQLLTEQLDDIHEHSSNFTSRELDLLVRSIRAKQNRLITNQQHFRNAAAGVDGDDVNVLVSNGDVVLTDPVGLASTSRPPALQGNTEMVDDPTNDSFRLKSVSRTNPMADPPTPVAGAPAPAPWETDFRTASTSKNADAVMMEGSALEQVAYTAM